jgi:AcrR family transcriptional regulator
MPAPERTTLDAIVSAGASILESDGLDALTMNAVAARVGVKAPSLYKRVRDRDALVRLVADAATRSLTLRLKAAEPTVQALAGAFRSFAYEQPAAFRLIMSPAADPELLAVASEPALQLAEQLAGERDALPAARLLTAWVVGFLTMELSGAFRLGGDLDDAFAYGLARLERAIAAG